MLDNHALLVCQYDFTLKVLVVGNSLLVILIILHADLIFEPVTLDLRVTHKHALN